MIIIFKEITLGSQVKGASRGHHTPWVRGGKEASHPHLSLWSSLVRSQFLLL